MYALKLPLNMVWAMDIYAFKLKIINKVKLRQEIVDLLMENNLED